MIRAEQSKKNEYEYVCKYNGCIYSYNTIRSSADVLEFNDRQLLFVLFEIAIRIGVNGDKIHKRVR